MFKDYTSNAYLTRLLILFIDIVLALSSLFLAAFLRYNLDIKSLNSLTLLIVGLVLLIRIISFRWFKSYAVIVRYAGVSDLVQVFNTVAGGSILLIGLAVLIRPYGVNIPISILLIDFFLLLVFMLVFRMSMPAMYQLLFTKNRQKENVILIGAGQLGAMTRNVIRQDVNSKFRIVAFLDDNPDIESKSMDGIPIYKPKDLESIVNSENISKAIFAIQNIDLERKGELIDLCLENNLKILQVPFKASWLDDEFQVNEIREFRIEDLLDRPSISLENKLVVEELANKKILVTGAAGSIGSELVRSLIKYNPAEIILLDQAESPLVNLELACKEELHFENLTAVIADVSDVFRISHLFETLKPQIVFHAAAYKHVPIMESYPREAVNVNVNGTRIVANCSHEYKVEKFVMVSTDKAVNPTNVMGASKRIAELYIQTLDKLSQTKFITTRFGNVLGSNGSVVPRFEKQISSGGPITVTHKDITRYFMTIPEAAQLIIEAGTMGKGGEIFLFDMGEPVKIYDLAIKMIKLSGLKPGEDIDIKITGLRPGEKLYEELLATKENSTATYHPKIMRALVRDFDFELIDKKIQGLIAAIDSESDLELVNKMKKLVPEFISQNSKYTLHDDGIYAKVNKAFT